MAEKNPYEKRGWTDAFLFVWLNVFGVGGAIGLSSILQHVIFWKGIFAAFIEWWDRVIRPLAHGLFYWAFDLFHVMLTDFWKDWLAIGTIISFSFLRQYFLLAYKQSRSRPIDHGYKTLYGSGPLIPPYLHWWTKFSPLVYSLFSPLLWPMTVPLYIVDIVRAVWPTLDFASKRFIVYSASSVVLPFYWLIIFAAVNEFVLK